MNKPKFSITIPAYKAAYLSEAIESCLNQTYPDFELIIVDDCSPEDLAAIVNKFSDDRIRYYRNDTNCGALNVVDNWNICLSYCLGEYVICMGDDDKLLPCCLEEYYKLISKYPDLGLYHGWTEIIDEESNFYKIQERRPEWESVYSMIWHRLEKNRKVYIGDWLFDIKQLRAEGGFYKIPMAWGSDEVSSYRAAIPKGCANTQVLCFQYRENRHTLSRSNNADLKVIGVNEKRKWIENFLKTKPTDELDLKYYSLLPSCVKKFFLIKTSLTIKEDMITSPLRLFHWIKVRKKYGLSTSLIIYSFFEALRKLIKK